MRVATEISRIAARSGMGGRVLLPQRIGSVEDLPNLLERLEKRDISKGERVYHPLFGTGWVEAVDAQSLRRKDGSEAVFAYVRFDIGQSCKFHFIRMQRKKRPTSGRQSRPSERETQLPLNEAPEASEHEPADTVAPTGLSPLDADEIQLLQQLASGKSTRDLARELGISSAAVVTRLREIFLKLGVAQGAQALGEARRRGLIH